MKQSDFERLQQDAFAQQILDRLAAGEQQLHLQERKIHHLTGLLNAASNRLVECEKICKAHHVTKIAAKSRFEPLFPVGNQ